MDNTPKFISDFIELYRQLPCLWRYKEESYSNKVLKYEAYTKLVDLYRTVLPGATIETVKKKINNLRCAFRKEFKKVKANDCYTPSLWYYNLLLFTSDQDAPGGSYSNDDPFSMTSEAEEGQPFLSLEFSPGSEFSASASEDKISIPSPVSIKKEMKSPKRKKQFRGTTESSKAIKENDEFDGIGMNVACKLRRMDEEQKMFAEMLINRVLMNGLKGRLREETDLTGLLPRNERSVM